LRISCNNVGIQKAVQIINKGGIVIFPTDTVYGIGCDPYNQNGVLSLYKIKKRILFMESDVILTIKMGYFHYIKLKKEKKQNHFL